jgi:hypothetical protein
MKGRLLKLAGGVAISVVLGLIGVNILYPGNVAYSLAVAVGSAAYAACLGVISPP